MSGVDILKVKTRKYTECEIDLKDFLLSEKEKMKQKMMTKTQSSEDRFDLSLNLLSFFHNMIYYLLYLISKKADDMKRTNSIKEPDVDEPEKVHEEPSLSPPKVEPELMPQISTEEMKKKQSKKDEDPRITKFKNAETVKEIYQLAEELIAGDGKKKLLKQIKQLKKALNLSMIKGAQ